MLTEIKVSFKGESMRKQYKVLDYRTCLYFHDYQLANEIDDNGYSDRNIDNEIKIQKAIKQELVC